MNVSGLFRRGKAVAVASAPAMPLAERVRGFVGWVGPDLPWAIEYIRSWKTGGLLDNETEADMTHDILDAIKADPRSFKAGLERFKRLNENSELQPR